MGGKEGGREAGREAGREGVHHDYCNLALQPSSGNVVITDSMYHRYDRSYCHLVNHATQMLLRKSYTIIEFSKLCLV